MPRRLIPGLLAAALAWPLTALAALPVPGFTARYSLALSGVPVGEATVTLDEPAPGRYRMRSEAAAKGQLAMLLPDRLSEEAEGTFGDDGPQPGHYRHERRGGRERESVRIDFDPAAGEVRIEEAGSAPAKLALAPGMLDPLSLQLRAMWLLRQGRPPESFTLVDDASPDTYRVESAGRETVKTGRGPVEAEVLRRGRPGDKRTATFWFAPKFGYVPVQIVQTRKGRETLRMTLIDVSGEAVR
ncbi:MAG TPA: DUF3108 domain-containing protein [Plasticicumulans sp.]|nr:DUF3108 domain-containing protein [Plasticicumulans sp.]